MRILYCNKYNYAFSGTESYLFSLMELMRSRGHEVALFSMADPRGEATPYDRHFVPHIDFKLSGQSFFRKAKLAAHAIYSTDARRCLRTLIAEFRPDVAHVRNIYHHLSPSILFELKSQRVPVIFHLSDFKLLCPSYNLVANEQVCERCRGGKYWNVMTQNCYGSRGSGAVLAAEAFVHRWLKTYERCVDLFLAPSQFVRNKLIENGFDSSRIEVLPHFQKLPDGSPPRLLPDAPILYFGRLSPEKGIADLLRAMQQVPSIRLQIAGDGPQRAELETLARELKPENVQFLGHLRGDSLQQRIAAARFTVFPSHAYETFGKSILESYAWGRAVVASDLGSRRALVRDGQTGLLFPAGDVRRLTEAISLLASHPELCARLGAAGRTLVRHNHSPQNHYNRLVSLYAQTFESKVSKPGLRIAFIGGRGVVSRYSGVEGYYEEVGPQLAAMGHEVTVYCRSYFTPPLGEHHGMRIVRLPTIRSKHLETLLHTLLSTMHAAFGPYDVVHYQCLGPALFSFVPRLFGKRTVVTVQGLDWQRKKWGWLAAHVLRWGEQASAHLPNATMVVSHALQHRYETHHSAKVTYIPNGTTIRKKHAPSRLMKWGIEPGNYILFLGRFSPEKNCHLLIQAFERLHTRAQLVLAGGSSYSDAYADELRTHQNDRVRLLDWVSGDAMEELLTNAMLFVLPSDLEGLSLALLDAMGAGICVLASDVPENRELVDGVGYTFRPGDVEDLERMLRLLISRPELRSAAAQRAQERVRQNYLWPGIALQVSQTYWQLMKRRPDGRPQQAA